MTYEKIGLNNVLGATSLMTEGGTWDECVKLLLPYESRSSYDYGNAVATDYYSDSEKTKKVLRMIAWGSFPGESVDRQLVVYIYRNATNYNYNTLFNKRNYSSIYIVRDDDNNVVSVTLLDQSKLPIVMIYKDNNGNICTLACTSVSGSAHARFGVYNGAYNNIATNSTPFAVYANYKRGQAVSLAKLPTNDNNNSRAINIFLTPFTPYYPSSDGGLIMDTYKINDSTYLMNQIMAVQLT